MDQYNMAYGSGEPLKKLQESKRATHVVIGISYGMEEFEYESYRCMGSDVMNSS